MANQLATLPNWNTPFPFDPVGDPTNPGLQAGDGNQMVANDGTTVIATPSSPDASGDGFNMGYGASAPSPPPSS